MLLSVWPLNRFKVEHLRTLEPSHRQTNERIGDFNVKFGASSEASRCAYRSVTRECDRSTVVEPVREISEQQPSILVHINCVIRRRSVDFAVAIEASEGDISAVGYLKHFTELIGLVNHV